jgi:hypothetical protein
MSFCQCVPGVLRSAIDEERSNGKQEVWRNAALIRPLLFESESAMYFDRRNDHGFGYLVYLHKRESIAVHSGPPHDCYSPRLPQRLRASAVISVS